MPGLISWLFPGLLIAHDSQRPHSRNCLITDVITVSLPYLLFKNSSVWILRRTGNPLAEQVFLTLPPSHCLNHFSWCSGHAWTCPVRSLCFVRSRHTRLWPCYHGVHDQIHHMYCQQSPAIHKKLAMPSMLMDMSLTTIGRSLTFVCLFMSIHLALISSIL